MSANAEVTHLIRTMRIGAEATISSLLEWKCLRSASEITDSMAKVQPTVPPRRRSHNEDSDPENASRIHVQQ